MQPLLTRKDQQYQKNGFLEFSGEELDSLSEDEITLLKEFFQGYALMKLPRNEITFFEWLRINDRPVWDDLWSEEESLYLVSIDLLGHFIPSGNGFPICDLIDEDNYWFTTRMIKPKGREMFPQIEEKMDRNERLGFEEALLLEVARGAIDLWHFCYRYRISIPFAKQKIAAMQHDDLIVHLPDREDLVKYIDF